MAKAPPSAKRDRIKAFVPALVDYTNDVVYGDLWERKGLSKRDRSLITVAALIATYRPEQLETHLTRAIGNGVTQEEISETITHLAFYAGWPAAMSAAQLAYTVLVEGKKAEGASWRTKRSSASSGSAPWAGAWQPTCRRPATSSWCMICTGSARVIICGPARPGPRAR